MDEIRPFQIHSFEDEAQEILASACAKAKEILQAANAEKVKILDEWSRQGLEQGRAEGREAAAAEERKRIAGETAGLQDLLARMARAVEDQRGALIAAAERDLVKLAVAIAEKIVRAEVDRREDVAAAAVKRAIELAADKQELRVLLHPADVEMIETYLPTLRQEHPEIGRIKIEAGDAVSRGGCVVMTPQGSVDADIVTQIREIERGLLG